MYAKKQNNLNSIIQKPLVRQRFVHDAPRAYYMSATAIAETRPKRKVVVPDADGDDDDDE